MDVGGRNPVGLVHYVESMLREGKRFKDVAKALQFRDVRQLKRFMSKELGHKFTVHHQLSLHELWLKIEELLPLREYGVQWGTRQVRKALAVQNLWIPLRHVEAVLDVISPYHRARRRIERHLIRVQYNVVMPMALWHIDCKHNNANVWFLSFRCYLCRFQLCFACIYYIFVVGEFIWTTCFWHFWTV